MNDIKYMTLDELLAVPYSKTRREIGIFNGFIIVPKMICEVVEKMDGGENDTR